MYDDYTHCRNASGVSVVLGLSDRESSLITMERAVAVRLYLNIGLDKMSVMIKQP